MSPFVANGRSPKCSRLGAERHVLAYPPFAAITERRFYFVEQEPVVIALFLVKGTDKAEISVHKTVIPEIENPTQIIPADRSRIVNRSAARPAWGREELGAKRKRRRFQEILTSRMKIHNQNRCHRQPNPILSHCRFTCCRHRQKAQPICERRAIAAIFILRRETAPKT